MELVIKIPEEYYKAIKEIPVEQSSADMLIIRNGTPLPEGHGKIVDIETLIDMFWDGDSMEITKYDLSVIEPLIEADKE